MVFLQIPLFLLEGAFPAENILEKLEPEQFQFLGAVVGNSQPLEFLPSRALFECGFILQALFEFL